MTHQDSQRRRRFTRGFQQHSAPSEAPEGRTLEHETLEDDEMEFHPMPENIEALSEVAGDLELEMEEETLDNDNGYSDRWIPKVADVDEDEVVAAEERGETRFAGWRRRRARRKREAGEEEKRPRRTAGCGADGWLSATSAANARDSIAATISAVAEAEDAATMSVLARSRIARSR